MVKKGESLVEVLVSCGILMLVFAGSLTMLVQSVNLNLASRQRTEAIALAQTRLSDYVTEGRVVPTGPGISDPIKQSTNTDDGTCLASYTPVSGAIDNNTSDKDCENPATSYGTLQKFLKDTAPERTAPNQDKCSYITLDDLDGDEAVSPLTDSYQKVVVHVRWYSKGLGNQDFNLAKLIRKPL